MEGEIRMCHFELLTWTWWYLQSVQVLNQDRWCWSMRDPRERLIRRFITEIYSVHKSCFFFRNISCLDFLALYTTGVPDASVIPTDTRNLFDSERWQTRAHRYGLCPHSGQMTLQNLLHFFVNIVSDGTEFAFTAVLVNMVSNGTEFAFTCETGFVCMTLYECVDKVRWWAKARVATSKRYLWPGYWR